MYKSSSLSVPVAALQHLELDAERREPGDEAGRLSLGPRLARHRLGAVADRGLHDRDLLEGAARGRDDGVDDLLARLLAVVDEDDGVDRGRTALERAQAAARAVELNADELRQVGDDLVDCGVSSDCSGTDARM